MQLAAYDVERGNYRRAFLVPTRRISAGRIAVKEFAIFKRIQPFTGKQATRAKQSYDSDYNES